MSSYSGQLGHALLRHRTEVAEKAARVEAERVSAAKSRFIAHMSHELRTPLNAIIGFSQLLKEGGVSAGDAKKIAEYAGYINDSADHLLAIINDILSISKMAAGKYKLEVEQIDIYGIIKACASLVSPQARQSGIELSINIDDNIPAIAADPVKLKQIVTNILSNAVKFTDEGGEVSILARPIADNQVVIAIADTGIGMTPEEVQIALTPFEQVDTSLARQHEGTGLGLVIAKKLTQMHGGKLEISSKKGIGTAMAIVLPIQPQINDMSNQET
jgi:two-component system cell cycle sensor histidine kinase PleC